MLYLDREATRAALPMALAIEAMELAFSDDRESPLRSQLGGSLFMPGRAGRYTAVKVVSIVPGNPVGIVVVFELNGSPLGLVDAPTLTAIRTGAAAGLATRLLANAEASVMAMLGAGAMAPDQIEAVKTVRPIERVLVWSRNLRRAEALAELVGGEAVTDPDAAVAAAQVVSCATPSRSPLFSDGSVRPGTHINAVGAFTPDMCEVPSETVWRAYVVVDDLEAAAAEAGDLLQADRPPVCTMGDVLAGRHPQVGEDVTMFKSVGIASQDVAAAVAALEGAREKGLGDPIG
ncbi:MAG TPA: Gfo/Idh/MocA family oxidoreductase [Acidimicrobiia bacterium]|nr:Gfo/Idh/MocA family oxidoreductase [Acidimicrobiia bacterium]